MKIKKQDWIEASWSRGNGIDAKIVETDLGKKLKLPKNFGWERLCFNTYKVITGKELFCELHGLGFRSRWFGEQVASVWPE